MRYIAYGSNMSKEQMAYRCPDAKLLATGYIKGARLEFFRHATVEGSQIKGARVPMAVWEISAGDERRLDLYEGVPDYYVKEECSAFLADGSEIKGMIYLMKLIRPEPPTQSYFEGIMHAYAELGFGPEIKTVLEPALHRSLRRR